jgi:hypothetical protein
MWLGNAGRQTAPAFAAFSTSCTSAVAEKANLYNNFLGLVLYGRGVRQLVQVQLARLRRKSKCHSKSKDMLKYSVMLLMLKRNGSLNAILN